jgi:hypothetical protein
MLKVKLFKVLGYLRFTIEKKRKDGRYLSEKASPLLCQSATFGFLVAFVQLFIVVSS